MEELLAAIVDSSDDGIVSKTLNGVITSWNRGAERIFGYTPQEAIGQHISFIFPPERLPEEEHFLSEIAAGRRVEHFETWRVRKDGRLIPVSVTLSPVRDGNGTIVGASKIVRDISDQVRRAATEGLLIALNDATRSLRDPDEVTAIVAMRVGRHFQASRCAYGDIDRGEQYISIMRDYCDGVSSIAGSHKLRDFGEILADLKAHRTIAIADVRHDPRTAHAAAAFDAIEARAILCVPLVKSRRLVSTLALHHREPRAWTDDEVRLVEHLAERTWFAVETARAERALRESRDVLSLAMRGGRLGAWSRDLVTNEVWWSRELEELFGLPPGGFAGTTSGFLDFVQEDDRPALEAAVNAAVASGRDYVVEFRFRHASGAWRWMEGRGRAVYLPDGTPLTLHGIGIDITERKRFEDALMAARDAAESANRSKDEFMAMLGHELRNPLAPILTALQLMKLRADDTSERERAVIERQVNHLTRLVDDLLDVSRIARGKVELKTELLEIAEVVARAIEIASPLLEERSHTLTVDMPRSGLLVEGDAARLSQVATNLLTNAAKYTPVGGRVAVMARRDGDEVVLRVRDSGIGIPREALPRVFDLFMQAPQSIDRASGGLGLGLTIVRSLVERHHGRVSAHSEGKGRGSEFVVRLPMAAERPRRESTPRARTSLASLRRGAGRILIVDDNRDAAEMLGEVLQTKGYDTRVALDGPGALAVAAVFKPNAAFLDIGLPVMDGYELAARLRQVPGLGGLRLIAVTGYGQPTDRERTAHAGFDYHIVKPVDFELLEQVLAATRSASAAS